MAPIVRKSKVNILHGPIADQHVVQAIREIEKHLQRLATTNDAHARTQANFAAVLQTLSDNQSDLARAAANNLATVRRQIVTGGGTPTGGGGTDNGDGEAGLAAAGPDGHVTGTLNAFLVGQIVGGVGNEFPGLLAPTTDDAARVAQRYEIVGRMIWHLNLAGFSATRYTITYNAYHLVVDNLVDGQPTAYRVIGYGDFDVPYVTRMEFEERSPRLGPGQVGTVWPDAGISD